jgi:hypothetical protein
MALDEQYRDPTNIGVTNFPPHLPYFQKVLLHEYDTVFHPIPGIMVRVD